MCFIYQQGTSFSSCNSRLFNTMWLLWLRMWRSEKPFNLRKWGLLSIGERRLRCPCVSCIFLWFLPLNLRNFTCLVASLDINSFLKARLTLGQRFKDVLNVICPANRLFNIWCFEWEFAEKFVNLCREKIGLDVKDETVDRAHWVGKKEEGTNRAIIRLKTHKDKLTILCKRKNLRGSGFYINEDLTKINQKLSYTARVTCTNVDTPWTVDGKIYVKRKWDGRRF